MDYDGDGIPDLVSGSYDPGEIYLFRGEGNGKFKARETITDKAGKPIVRVPNQTNKIESFGSWLALVDWDDDGDLDILLGGYDGTLHLRVNEGTRAKPEYAAANTPVLAGGKPLVVPEGHANPVIADWDGDGLWDILSGSADGGVYWYRNVGKLGAPEFAAGVAIVPPHKGNGYDEFLEAGEEPGPGIRSQIAVADFDGDGKLAILLGDFCTHAVARDDLKPGEKTAVRELRKRMAVTADEMTSANTRMRAKLMEAFKHLAPGDWLKDDTQEAIRKKDKELREAPDYKKVAEESASQATELKKYIRKSKRPALGDDTSEAHGYVWLFRRE